MSSISASTTSTTAYKVTADTTGTLVFQTGSTPTTAVTNDGSQNVGVGVTPSAWGSGVKALQFDYGAFSGSSSIGTEVDANCYYNGTNWIYRLSSAAGRYNQAAGAHTWYTAPSGTAGNAISFTQAMTLDASGNLLVGTTTASAAIPQGFTFIYGSNASYANIGHANGSASGNGYIQFAYNSGVIGNITQNGTTGVLYNLTSDYRLKNNQEALTGAKDFIMALKPKKWQWWDGSGEGVGFVAHEFMEVAKYSGHGEKDAVETIEIKDEDGNVTGTEERPVYQSIQPSSSEVMANLVSLIQEQQALITQLQADVAALKG